MKNFNNEMLTNVDGITCTITGYELPIMWREYNILNKACLYRAAPLSNYITAEECQNYYENEILDLDNKLINTDILYAYSFYNSPDNTSIGIVIRYIMSERVLNDISNDDSLLKLLSDKLTPMIFNDNRHIIESVLYERNATSVINTSSNLLDDTYREYFEYLIKGGSDI